GVVAAPTTAKDACSLALPFEDEEIRLGALIYRSSARTTPRIGIETVSVNDAHPTSTSLGRDTCGRPSRISCATRGPSTKSWRYAKTTRAAKRLTFTAKTALASVPPSGSTW